MRSPISVMPRWLLLCAFILGANAWTSETYPNPMLQPESCGRGGLKGWVCDPDGLVSRQSLDVIEGHIRAIYDAKDPFQTFQCGETVERWQIAVAITKAIEGSGDAAARTEEFAKRTHDKWGVGSACGGGALLVISVEDRQMYISSGEAALKHLYTSRVTGIRDRMKPNLRAGNYGLALEQAVVEMGLYLSEAEAAPEIDSGSGDAWVFGGMMSLIAGIWGFSWWRGRNEQKNFNAVKSKLHKMQQDLRDAKENKYLSTTCPICLEDFEPPRQGNAAADGASGSEQPEAEPLLPPDAPSTSAAAAAGDTPEISSAAKDSSLAASMKAKPASGAPESAVKAPFLLPCSHTFCEPCIMKWLEEHTGCPVCRKPVDGSSSGASTSARPPSQPAPRPGTDGSPRTQSQPRADSRPACRPSYGVRYMDRPYLGQAAYLDELAFRMAMLRRRYPQYITPAMEHDMVSQAAQGGDFNWVQHRDFLARNPELRAERERAGASSSSVSFGGGRSAGGSGGGW